MTPAYTGALVGLVLGLGAALIAWRLASRRIRLIDRVTPYLREPARSSRLLRPGATTTPFPNLERTLRPVLADFSRLFERLGSGTVSIRRRLLRAGSPMRLETFRMEQLIWSTIGLAVGLALALVIGIARGVSVVPLTLAVVLCAVAGALLRDQALTRRVKAREERMAAEFPTVAELLALAVGAGEAPVAALERVARTTRGELSDEVRLTLADVRSGIPIAEALERMADRTDLSAVSRFTDGVATAIARGTPLAEVLRAQAQDARAAGHRELMETGGRKEIAMMAPVIFLLLPVTVLFALFPGLSLLSIGP